MSSRLTMPSLRHARFFLLAVLVSACNPYVFELQRSTGWPIEGRILRERGSVEVVNAHTLQMSHPSVVAMRTEQITDGVFDAEMQWLSAGDVDLLFRSTPYDDSTSHPDQLRVRIGVTNTIVTYAGKEYSAEAPTPVDGSRFRIRIAQHGRIVSVVVGCTQVARFETMRPSTQWVTIRPDVGTSIEFYDPQFIPLTEEYSRVSYP